MTCSPTIPEGENRKLKTVTGFQKVNIIIGKYPTKSINQGDL